MKLNLVERKTEVPGVESFIFEPRKPLAWKAGQYLHYLLHHEPTDDRGSDRWFTVASAPFEKRVMITTRFADEKSSSFKKKLFSLAPGKSIEISVVEGDFIIENPAREHVFIAGGIGITPFRSMLQYLLDRQEARPIVILYGNERQDDIAYREVLDAAEGELGVRTIYAVASGAARGQYPGYIDAKLVRKAIPDFRERMFYISGPQAMVKALRKTLLAMGVHRSRIKADFFPGFA